MEKQDDFKELLALFNNHGVEYLIVGGYALAFHGAPRSTGDIDLFVNPDPVNAERIMKALDVFGFGDVGLTAADFSAPGRVVQLGYPPVRIDILTSISGVTWEAAWQGRSAGMYDDLSVHFIGKREFLNNKKAAGRKKDDADTEALTEK
ncbi:MAG: hypothetical protein HZC28_13480 [Spirochaetes bacterium]|nr:hypothetical protein [Spirochaetota bacterium]